jgi:hypothetical protein
MKAIFCFNKVHYHYKPINNDFLKLAKLSVKSAKKYYKTKFYGDRVSLNYFNNNDITFDEVVIINDDYISQYKNIYSISKIFAMMNEIEPYILLDFDVILLEKLESNHTITYGQPEIVLDVGATIDDFNWAYNSYINPFEKYVRQYYPNEEVINFKWSVYPSFCALMVNNPLFVSDTYKSIFNRLPKEIINQITPTLFEQLLLHQNVLIYNVDFGFFIERNNYYNNNNNEKYGLDHIKLSSQKFVHCNINKENIKDHLNYLELII